MRNVENRKIEMQHEGTGLLTWTQSWMGYREAGRPEAEPVDQTRLSQTG